MLHHQHRKLLAVVLVSLLVAGSFSPATSSTLTDMETTGGEMTAANDLAGNDGSATAGNDGSATAGNDAGATAGNDAEASGLSADPVTGAGSSDSTGSAGTGTGVTVAAEVTHNGA